MRQRMRQRDHRPATSCTNRSSRSESDTNSECHTRRNSNGPHTGTRHQAPGSMPSECTKIDICSEEESLFEFARAWRDQTLPPTRVSHSSVCQTSTSATMPPEPERCEHSGANVLAAECAQGSKDRRTKGPDAAAHQVAHEVVMLRLALELLHCCTISRDDVVRDDFDRSGD